ncbi:MAG TPA: hypothetical protein VK967_03645 [Methylotenera sp.]|nr:hypothetical protein [Methylotenera sp.]
MRQLLCSFVLFFTILNAEAAVSDITRIYHETPNLSAFEICSGGGCAEIQHVALTLEEWQKVVAVFATTKDAQINAVQERKQIADAIGVLEKIVGVKTNTFTDRAGTFDNAAYPGQLDCNDEAINTTTYMRLMRQQGLIKLHEIEDMRTRNFFFTGWPHSTAVIHEIASGQRYAVDSWFYDNAMPATIVPFELWKSGYIPADSPIKHERTQSAK